MRGLTLADPAIVGTINNGRYVRAVLADTPVSYWRLGEASGTAAADVMGAHAGTYVNTPTLGAAGVMSDDTAVTFASASSQYVNTGDLSLFEAGDCTYEAWFKTTTTGTNKYLFSEGGASSPMLIVLYVGTTNRLGTVAVNDAGSAYGNVGGPVVTDGQWHHAVMVKSGTAFSGYLDGALITGPYTPTGSFGITNSRIGDGRLSGVESGFMNGTIDEVAVYATALSAARIAAHYAARI